MHRFMKRSAALIISAALLASFTPIGNIVPISSAVVISASADEVEATTWAELQEAINNASNGDTIKLTGSNYQITAGDEDSFLYVPAGTRITIDLNSKTLSRGLTNGDESAPVGNGFVLKNEGELTLTNGTLSNGYNNGNGGGIINNGTLLLTEDLYVNNNKCTGSGGGIYNGPGATLTLINNVNVDYNSANLDGGGIFNDENADLTVCGSDIQGNKAANGGGIFNAGVLNLSSYKYTDEYSNVYETDTYINDNNVSSQGGGIYSKGSISVEGSVSINNNKDDTYDYERNNYNNLYLPEGNVVNVSGKLGRANEDYYYTNTIGITLETPGVFTSNFKTHNGDTSISKYFFSDTSDYGVTVTESGEGKFDINYWQELQDRLNEIINSDEKNGTITLEHDYICYSGNENMEIPEGVTVVLDLNGHTIDFNQNDHDYSSTDWEGLQHESGCVISNHGTLTIKDSSGNNSGKIAGGSSHTTYSYSGGGIYNAENATLTIEGGTITGNRGMTGGVTNRGTFYLKGGVITENYATGSAGISGSVIVSGNPVIKDNYIIISQWVEDEETGGSHNVITRSESNIDSMTIGGALTDGAEIHLSSGSGSVTEGYKDYNGDTDPSTFFKSDTDGINVTLSNSGEVLLKKDRYLSGASLSLGSMVAVDFVFDITEKDSLRVNFEWADSKQSMDHYIQKENSIATCYLPAKELSDVITYTVLSDNDDVLETGTYCVKTDYLDKLTESTEYTESQKQMAAAAAHYAAAAQSLFNYNTGSLVNENIPYTPSAAIASIDELTSSFTKPEDGTFGDGGTLSYYGSSLLLENQLMVRHYFIATGDDVTNSLWNLKNKTGNYYYYDVLCDDPEEMVHSNNVELSYWHWNEERQSNEKKVVMEFDYTPMDYIYLALNSSNAADKTKTAAEAIYYFAQEAALYAASQE